MEAIGSLVVGLVCSFYGTYCILNEGTHHRGRGWLTREEAPKGYLFAVIIYLVLGISSMIYFFFLNIR